MRVLHILPAYYHEKDFNYEAIASYGGGERYAAELALAMSKYTSTTLVTFGNKDYTFKEGALEVIIIKAKPLLEKFNGNSEFVSIKLLKILKNYDILHAHKYFTDTTLLCGIFGKLFNKKVFATDLGFTGINFARILPMHRFVNKVLCLTAYDTKRMRLPESKVGVIHGGVDLNRYKYQAKKTGNILFVGRLLPHKGIDYLIEAIDPDVKCTIAGHPYNKSYLAYLKQKAKKKRIRFLLSPKDTAVINEIGNASALVLPSVDVDYLGNKHKNAELFGLVIAEAFARGTPAIVSNSSALPYVVKDGYDGYIVAQNNPEAIREKINIILNNPTVAQQLGQNARKEAEITFNWNNVAELALEYYN